MSDLPEMSDEMLLKFARWYDKNYRYTVINQAGYEAVRDAYVRGWMDCLDDFKNMKYPGGVHEKED